MSKRWKKIFQLISFYLVIHFLNILIESTLNFRVKCDAKDLNGSEKSIHIMFWIELVYICPLHFIFTFNKLKFKKTTKLNEFKVSFYLGWSTVNIFVYHYCFT